MDAVTLLEVPVIVTVDVPDAAEELAARVSVLPLNEAVTPLGKPEAARVTVPVNPFTSVTVMVSVALDPWATERVDAEGASVKPGVGLEEVSGG